MPITATRGFGDSLNQQQGEASTQAGRSLSFSFGSAMKREYSDVYGSIAIRSTSSRACWCNIILVYAHC